MNITYIVISVIILLSLIFIHKYFINRAIPDVKDNKIPKVIYQTYKNKNVPIIIKERWLKLNPEYEYHLYDDNDCYNFLIKYYTKEHADFFKYKIKDGPIKSDFWRVCILYQFGGIYADIDIFPNVPIDQFVDSDTTLYTCITDPKLDKNNLNPHFIATTPKNPLILDCINIYIREKINTEYSYLGWSITYIMYNTLTNYLNNYNLKEGKYKIEDQTIQFSQEICPNGDASKEALSICYIKQNGKNIMNNRDSNLYNSYTHEFI
jgi:mannosyltransferase OCH1-like enzyme